MKTDAYILWVILLASHAGADPVDQARAKQAASGWKAEGKHILNHRMDKPAKKVTSYPDFHVVELQPEGFIVVPADDTLPPVIAFSEHGKLEPDKESPLWTLLSGDMRTRMADIRANQQRFADFKTAGAGHRQPDRRLEQMEQRQGRFRELERRGQARNDRDSARRNQPSQASALGLNAAADDPLPGVSSEGAPVTITSVATVEGKVQITHDADASVSIYVSYDNFRTWELLDSGIVWPTWVSKQPAREISGFYKVEKDGLYDAFTVEQFRHPAPDQLAAFDDMLGTNPTLVNQSASVSDVRVSPLIASRWSQEAAVWQNCYNYYTPHHYPCGCVATAMAQLMRYWRCPATGIGQVTKTIAIDGGYTTATTRGGDGAGGAYNWDNMPLQPSSSPYNLAQWQMIGSLCYDAGVCVYMSYSYGASGAGVNSAASAFTRNFKYANSRCLWINTGANSTLWDNILRSNLAGGYPVLLGIYSANGGHCVVCDGFGYSGASLYYHINMGWAGACDAWYLLPTINDGYYNFNEVDDFAFNVFPSGTGELIGGRVVNTAGAPVGGATVTATGSGTYTTTTDSHGYFGVIVRSNQTYAVRAAKSGYIAASLGGIHVGSSAPDYNGNSPNGNYFGADITLAQFSLNAVSLTNSVRLSWTAPTNCGLPNNTVYIRWRTNRYPTNSSDGTEIYTGAALSTDHIGLDSSGTVTNYYKIWGNNGSPYASLSGSSTAQAVTVANPITDWVPMAAGDFNGDGKPDLIWRNSTSGRVIVWYMNGATRTGTNVLWPATNVNDAAWVPMAAGDFNGDGKPDLIWRNSTSGRVIVWYMNGVTRTGTAVLWPATNVTVSAWVPMAAGDFNGDGKPDLVWRNSTSGRVIVWYMNGATLTGTAVLWPATNVTDSAWVPMAAGDFNADGKPDLVWRNSTSGRVIVWYMNGVTLAGTAVVWPATNAGDSAWVPMAAGDFNADGKPDLVWRNSTSGRVIIWYMNAVTCTGTVAIWGN